MTENNRRASEAPSAPKQPTSDREATAAVAAFRLEAGRWPSPVSSDPPEAELGVWLHRQRTQLAQGAMDEFRQVALDESLEGWKITRAEGWLESARNLSGFFLQHGRRPKTWSKNKIEHQAGLWLDGQLSLLRAGVLSADRLVWLDSHCPRWNYPTKETS